MLQLGLFTFSDVSNDGNYKLFVLHHACREREFYWKYISVASHRRQLDCIADCHVGFACREEVLYVLPVPLPVLLRHQAVKRLANHFLSLTAEHLFSRPIEQVYQSIVPDGDHCLFRCIYDRSQQILVS